MGLIERLLKSPYDIRLAIDETASFFDGREMLFDSYRKDILLKRGIERNLEAIVDDHEKLMSVSQEFQRISHELEAKELPWLELSELEG